MNLSTIASPRARTQTRPQHLRSWLVSDAWIPPDLVKKYGCPCRPGFKAAAFVFLVTNGPHRLWCAFAGGRADDKAGVLLTEVGQMTLAALTHLPGLPPDDTLNLAFISSAARFDPVVGRVLSAAPDRSLVGFIGDMAGALDGLLFPYMKPQGAVKAAVELTAAGWPIEWQPLRPQAR
jgi:hypothetical protein